MVKRNIQKRQEQNNIDDHNMGIDDGLEIAMLIEGKLVFSTRLADIV